MTEHELFDLKYNQGLSTQELLKRFPDDTCRIHEIALLEIEEEMLREVIPEPAFFERLMEMKKRYGFCREDHGGHEL